jgi:hypothetical protein
MVKGLRLYLAFSLRRFGLNYLNVRNPFFNIKELRALRGSAYTWAAACAALALTTSTTLMLEPKSAKLIYIFITASTPPE